MDTVSVRLVLAPLGFAFLSMASPSNVDDLLSLVFIYYSVSVKNKFDSCQAHVFIMSTLNTLIFGGKNESTS